MTTAIGSSKHVQQLLTDKFREANLKPIEEQNVGAVIGEEIQRSAIVASLLSLFGILVYVSFRYEFSFAVAAVVAVPRRPSGHWLLLHRQQRRVASSTPRWSRRS